MLSTLLVVFLTGSGIRADLESLPKNTTDDEESRIWFPDEVSLLLAGYDLLRLAKEGNLTGVKEYVAKGADLDFEDGEPLTQAAENGFFAVVKYLLEAGANPDGTNVNEAKFGRVLAAAAKNNHVDIIDLLLDSGANITYSEFSGVRPPLEEAAKNGHLEAVQRLLEAGGDPNVENGTAMFYAAQNGHLDVVKALVAAGADVNARIDDSWRYVTKKGNLEIVRFLVESGTNITSQADNVLWYAAGTGDIEMVRFLLEAGSNLTCVGRRVTCPWHNAARIGRPDIVALFVEYGADINAVVDKDRFSDQETYNWNDCKGWTVMHIAARYGYPIAGKLLDLGADIDVRDARGRSPLQVAVHHEKSTVAKELLMFCPDLNITNDEGKTALDMAKVVALRNASEYDQFPVLKTILKKTMPERVAETPYNKGALNLLMVDIMDGVKSNATMKDQFKDARIDEHRIYWSFLHLFEERARESLVAIIEDHKRCKPSLSEDLEDITLGKEYLARCECLPGQGIRMNLTPLPEDIMCNPGDSVKEELVESQPNRTEAKDVLKSPKPKLVKKYLT